MMQRPVCFTDLTIRSSSSGASVRIDDLDRDAALGEDVGRQPRLDVHPRQADDRDVLAGRRMRPTPSGISCRLLGHVLLGPVQPAVLEADHRIVVADGCGQHALHVRRRGRRDDLQSGNVGEVREQALECCAPLPQPRPMMARTTSGTPSLPVE